MKRLTTALLVGLLLALGLLTATAAPAAAIPTETGCPSGYEVLVVDELLAQGYRVPAIVDAEGNNNGLICGHAYSEAARQQLCGPDCPVPIFYGFRDDDLKAQQYHQPGSSKPCSDNRPGEGVASFPRPCGQT